MKKVICTVLILALVLSLPFTTYANVEAYKDEKKIVLPLSMSVEDNKILNDSLIQKGNSNFFKFSTSDKTKYNSNSNIMLTMKEIKIVENNANVSGTGKFFLGQDKYSFNFKNACVNVIQTSNGKVVYDGAIDINIENEKYENTPCILDVTLLDDFSNGIISLSLGELGSDNGLAMLFWGEVFPEQQEVYRLNMNKVTSNNEINMNTLEFGTMAAEGYAHVGNAASKALGSTNYTQEFAVISVAKADPRDRNSTTGNELIRIFGRSYNVKNAVTGCLLVEPTSIEAVFQANQEGGFLEIDKTIPRVGYDVIPDGFDILSQLYPSAGTIIQSLNIFLSAISSTTVSTADRYGDGIPTKVTVKTYIDENNSYLDLPSNVAVSSAHTNKINGATVQVSYDVWPNNISFMAVESRGRVQYRCYLTGDKTSSVTTGYATYPHAIFD